MKTRHLALLLALAFLVVPLSAEVYYLTVSATATSQTVPGRYGKTLLVINDGADSVHARVFDAMETSAVATTADLEIKIGESFEFSRTKGIGAISIVCDTAETATVRLVLD